MDGIWKMFLYEKYNVAYNIIKYAGMKMWHSKI